MFDSLFIFCLPWIFAFFEGGGIGVVVVRNDHIPLFLSSVVKKKQIETYTFTPQRKEGSRFLIHLERFPRMLQNVARTPNPFAGGLRLDKQYFRLTCDASRYANEYVATLHLLSIPWSRYWMFIYSQQINWINNFAKGSKDDPNNRNLRL